MGEHFYSELKSFTNFEEITDDRHYTPVPMDWCIVFSDIVGSTSLIENQRYKDVNTIGAATIVAVKNALGKTEIPYVFGGDGATLLIPGTYRDLVARNLNSLRDIARKSFDINLRTAIIEVSDLVTDEVTIEVAKFELIAKQCIALFQGGGLALADKLAKGKSDQYTVPESEAEPIDLTGLSCRWEEIPNQHGFILSLLVKAKKDNAKQVYTDLIAKLTSIFDGDLTDANPVNPSLMTYRTIRESSENERRLEKGLSAPWLKRWLEIVAASSAFKWKLIPQSLFQSNAYKNAMRSHSDYRKFDDMFRMILDCSPKQVTDLSEYLDLAHKQGELSYGIHKSQTSRMTCFVEGLGEGNHIHFIDGGDGGYAKAAKNMSGQT